MKAIGGNKSGQGMTEYVIVVCLIAIACLLIVGVFGTNVRRLFSSASHSLTSGQAEKATLDDTTSERDVRISNFSDTD